jgi:hypothetical protein
MTGVPLADKIAEQGEPIDAVDSFELLSKPTLKLTDFDLLKIANDLRAKRVRFLKGVADRPGRTALPKKEKPEVTEESKTAITSHLLGELDNLKLDL